MQIRTLLRAKSLWLIMVLTGFAVATWTCKYPTGPQNPNTPPHTRLANVPANDTIARYIQRNAFPELQLDWVGDDPDGYVIGFQYRWTTMIVAYCNGTECDASLMLARLLVKEHGYKNVEIFFGGWQCWDKQRLPIEGKYDEEIDH